jgi:predicted protein tyrosine phosphatase
VSGKSRHQISRDDLSWAGLVVAMETKYKARILATFRGLANLLRIVSLDIPDEYQLMDAELITLIREGVEFHLKREFDIE